MSPLQYFQKEMAPLRKQLLEGQSPQLCNDCHVMEQHGKPSGRQRQLLKAGVMMPYFAKSLASSPLRPALDHSQHNHGHTDRTVSDWQIDLGNYCNGACVFCHPESSSTLAAEFKQLGLIQQIPPRSWCDDPDLVDRFVQDLAHSTNLRYLHFIGGETVITPGFKKILSVLVDAGIATQITIGFTTNLIAWSDAVVDLLVKFQGVNLGMSLETMTPVNDYVRYPAQQHQTKQRLDQWIQLGISHGWLMQIRTTPTCLTVHELDTVYDLAWQKNISVESCNFIDTPEFFRIGVLPAKQRSYAIQRLQQWIHAHPTHQHDHIVNTRDPNLARVQIVQDAQSYLNYLTHAEDESFRLPDLVGYLKRLESHRGNTILDYIPDYEQLFRSAGY